MSSGHQSGNSPSRRTVLALAAASAATATTGAAQAQPVTDIPIIDAHIHVNNPAFEIDRRDDEHAGQTPSPASRRR